MFKYILLLIILFYHQCQGIYICETCNSIRDENGFYYGYENGEECIIDPQACNTGVIRVGYFNTCSKCKISVYVNNIFYGWEDGRECQIDVDYCNSAHGNKAVNRDVTGTCQYCFYSDFDKQTQTYYGFENGHHCYLNMTFCTEKSNFQNPCNWCEPLGSVSITSNKDFNMKSRNPDGEECTLDIKKCGFLNMRNYNETQKNCTYCSVLKREGENYFGHENNDFCSINKDNCANQIAFFNNIENKINPKDFDSVMPSSASVIKYIDLSIITCTIILLSLINLLF